MQRTGQLPLVSRLARDGFVALSMAFLLLRLFQVPPWDQSVDAYAYWATRDGNLYDEPAGALGAYVYPPPLAQLLTPLTLLPWPLFVTIWTAFNLGALWWLMGRWSLPTLLFLPVPFEIVSGNVHLLYAMALVLAVRGASERRPPLTLGPVAWALPILTKITPAVGLSWHLVRREWRAAGIAAGVTGVIVLVSYVVSPEEWEAWLDVISSSSSTPETLGWFLPIDLVARLPVAVALAAGAGLTGRGWLLPIAVTLALPIVWLNSLAILVACVPLWRWRRSPQTAGDPTAAAGTQVVAV